MNVNDIAIIGLDYKNLFSQKICLELSKICNSEVKLIACKEIIFANQEKKVVIEESIRGKDVYIVHLFDEPLSSKSINDNIFTLACAAQAAYYAGAKTITGVIPQFPYARQEKKRGREPITAKIIGNLLESVEINHLITLDIHSEAIEGHLHKTRLENLHMGRLLIDYIHKYFDMDDLMIVAPDMGSAPRGSFFAKRLNLPLAIINKERNYKQQSKIEAMRLVGVVQDKDVIVCDDMIATGGTIVNACKVLKDNGAKNIFISVALPYFSGDAIDKFKKAYQDGLVQKIIATNAVYWGKDLVDQEWYEVLDICPLFARVIYNLNAGLSVSNLLT